MQAMVYVCFYQLNVSMFAMPDRHTKILLIPDCVRTWMTKSHPSILATMLCNINNIKVKPHLVTRVYFLIMLLILCNLP